MLHATRWSLAAVLLCGAACNPAPKTESASLGGVSDGAPPAGLSPADEAAIRALDDAWGKAATAGDGSAIAALYTDDATLYPPMEGMVKGEASKKYWIGFTEGFTATAQLTTETVDGRGDLAYATGTYRMTITPKKPGAKAMPPEEGKYVEVLKKQADGSWKIAHDIWNTSAPPAK
jgi:uncharacterized protein (TIGR02246 family)